MANKLILKRSSVAAKVPLAGDLEPGELAVNLTDQKLYSKKTDGTVILVGSGLGGAGDVQGPASATDNALVRFNGTTGKVIQNSSATMDDSGNLTLSATGHVTIPKGTTAQRPGTPTTGMMRYNTTTSQYEVYDGTIWRLIQTNPYTTSVEYLVVAGGGGGGTNVGGGGGGGGYRDGTADTPILTNLTLTVGAGGAVNASGGNSVFNTITSAGGGKGGSQLENGTSGGSGGGAGGNESGVTNTGGAGNTPAVTPSQGFGGGTAFTGFALPAAGGGGAGAAGGNGAGGTGAAGSGGAGKASSITGTSVTRAGGGGGSQYFNNSGAGGAGGGGRGGAVSPATAAGNGGTNSGGGGGGPYSGYGGGLGGSGIVILKYLESITLTNPGGGLTFSTVTASGFKITTFTAGTGNIQLA
jgi:hypothetical protein